MTERPVQFAALVAPRGTLVLVVGPSGSGKDTLIRLARIGLASDGRFVFPRRLVTRAAVAAFEDHGSIDPGTFARMRAAGEFALAWEAHGLGYGLAAGIVDDIAAGRVVVCNGSRRIVSVAAAQFSRCHVLLIDADAEVRARRLALRGREDAPTIAARLRREVEHLPAAVAVTRIDNSGDLATAATATLVALLNIAASEPSDS